MVPIEKQRNTRKLTFLTNLEEDECLGVSFMLNRCTVLEMITFEMGSGTFSKVCILFIVNSIFSSNDYIYVLIIIHNFNNNWCTCLYKFCKVHEEYYLSDADYHEETYLSNSDDEDGYSSYNGSYNQSSSLDYQNIFQYLTSTLKVVEINIRIGNS